VAQAAHALIAQEEIVVDQANKKLQDVPVELTANALIAKEEIAVAPLHVAEKPAVSLELERRLHGLKLPHTTMDSKTSS
jgi:hypothetical protein